jgi:alkanesulfonate monooxygenase SsuD/methylene tetrahydromethanopterin reductase-like flavin-dependent oxidoreductase (luciferase family)
VSDSAPVHLAIALQGAGWHPAAWRFAPCPAAEFFRLRCWADQGIEAERGLADFVTIEDALSAQSSPDEEADWRTDRFTGRFDAIQLAAGMTPLTRRIGFVPVATVTHTEPFHLSTAIATLDYVGCGRAGWQPKVSCTAAEARHFGRRPPSDFEVRGAAAREQLEADLLAEAADVVEAVRRLWDSWEDDAVIRDLGTGRYLDASRLHYVDFQGTRFSVRGPSVTPRPPQGQPVVAVLAHDAATLELAARGADIVYVTPRDAVDVRRIVADVREAEARVGRRGPALKIFADVVVFLGADHRSAVDRKARWDDVAGDEQAEAEQTGQDRAGDASTFTGTPAEFGAVVDAWHSAGLDGVRLRPASAADDLVAITRSLVPELQARGLFRRSYDGVVLRDHLGLGKPANRYAE